MKIQRVRNGELSTLEMLTIPRGTEVFITGESGTLKIEEDQLTGALTITPMHGAFGIVDRDS